MHIPKFEHISFDIRNLYQFEDFIEFNDSKKNIEVITENNNFILDLDNWTYLNKYWFIKAFWFTINFDLDDFKWVKKIIIPTFLQQRFKNDIKESRIFEIHKSKEEIKSTYNIILNTYE